MKSFVFVLCCFAVVLADPVQERWNRVHQQCQQSPETYVDDDIFEQLKRGQKPTLPSNFGLHANCMLTKLGLQDNRGNVLLEGIRRAAEVGISDNGKINRTSTMKSFVFVLCCFAVVLADPVQERWNRVHQQCQQSPETYVDDDIFEQLKRGQKPTLPSNFGLHANCMLTKLGLQDNRGNVLPEGIRRAAEVGISDNGKINRIVDDCNVNKNSKEDTALELFGCLGKHRVNIGQL
ncbi:unnamed protein product [Ceutorhynchus assimilis]|uniref:Uncharacterized protein n=1 Tax=Ceutorhynchus assimilis TaxID=467358 RepID=A0A9P0GQJ9_9CUCU|nr:unnamed protein product [Ceutorhynchus assimilis]